MCPGGHQFKLTQGNKLMAIKGVHSKGMQRQARASNYFPKQVIKTHTWEAKWLGFSLYSSGFERTELNQ